MTETMDFAKQLNIEKTMLLYKGGRFGVIAILLTSIFLINYLWETVDHTILLAWLLLTLVMNITRLASFLYFQKLVEKGEENINYTLWKNLFFTGVLISAILWSSTMFFPFQKDVLISMLLVLIILISLNAGTITLNSSSLPIDYVYLIITLVPSVIQFSLIAAPGFSTISALILIYILAMMRITHSLNDTIITNINLKLENKNHSLLDPLTKLWNRRQLFIFMDKLIPQTVRRGECFSLILLDLDYFKIFNDTYGHLAGDDLLKKVAEIISKEIREGDLAVRYGGEEFLIILPDTETKTARSVCERIRKNVLKETPISISAGLSCYSENLKFDDMLNQADLALYRSKADGRNKITVFSPKILKNVPRNKKVLLKQ